MIQLLKITLLWLAIVLVLGSCRKITSTAGLILGTDTISAVMLPAPLGSVSDFEELLTPAQIRSLDSIIVQHETNDAPKVSIVTVADIGADENLPEYAERLHDSWEKEPRRRNSVLIVHSARLGATCISVGSRLRKRLTDKEAKRIVRRSMEPAFAENDHYTGLKKGLRKVMTEIGR